MFIYAWSSFPRVHWIALAIGITVRYFFTFEHSAGADPSQDFCVGRLYHLSGRFHLFIRLVCNINQPLHHAWYLIIFGFSYGPFASSASAGQSLMRGSSHAPDLAGSC